MTTSASESSPVPEQDIESVTPRDKNPVRGDSAQSSPISEERVKEIQARLKQWDRGEVSKQTFPVSWAEADALCRSLRAAWAENVDLHNAIAKTWEALGITSYTGKHISEHVAELRTQNQTQAESITDFQENEKSLRAQLTEAEKRLDDALVRAAEDQDEHSAERAELAKKLAQVEQEKTR